jgi:hypothetical protein
MRHRSEKIAMLSRELELLMGERKKLLQVVGATAALIASLDSSHLPLGAVKPADLVASSINALSEETLQDALASVSAKIEEDECGTVT